MFRNNENVAENHVRSGDAQAAALVDSKAKRTSDVQKTLRMAKYSYAAMVEYAMMRNCNCRPNSWTRTTDYDIGRFAAVEVEYPRLADIEGDVGAGFKKARYADPAALLQKAKHLGF